MKKYEILGGNLPVVVCELSAGESMITESGSMSWMSPNMKMEQLHLHQVFREQSKRWILVMVTL